jgi:hypothetical protein
MNWTMVGALREFFGAFAVVASLLYVGHQVRQNNRLASAEAYRDVTLSWARMLHLWADDTPAAKVFMDRTGVRLADLPDDVRNAYLLDGAARELQPRLPELLRESLSIRQPDGRRDGPRMNRTVATRRDGSSNRPSYERELDRVRWVRHGRGPLLDGRVPSAAHRRSS